ncbi:MAG: class I SAM-dependent methyltransferase [Planctomycetes bacterium]|nr:class I SAM-dependent methyltransferase [Planctomycetota bacterium]
MSQAASIEWWNKSLDEVGIHSMDKLVSADANWSTVLQSGRDDLARAISITGMTCGMDRTAVEVGCGLGRMSTALAEHFGRVVGVDIAPRLIEEACRRNELPQVTFEVADGVHLRPQAITECDTIFSYEVFYYINPDGLTTYFRDAFQLLRSGGQFVFQLNMEPVRWKTRLSFLFRRVLYTCGIKHWRGWPTGAGYRRYHHSPEWLSRTLTEIGFRVDKIAGPTARQQWVVASKS